MTLALLVDGLEICNDDTAILSALWYGDAPLPQTVAERRGVFRHLVMEKRCKRLQLHGSVAQISEIVHLGEYAPDISDFEAVIERKVRPITELLALAAQQQGTALKWESLSNPRGTSLSVKIRVRIAGVEQETSRAFDSLPDNMEWHLDASWPS